MASPFPSASLELDYPLYAVSFDPRNANRLVVGGGGGASRTGVDVGHPFVDTLLQTVLETNAPDELRIAGEIELSRDEDSVMSLAFGADDSKSRNSHNDDSDAADAKTRTIFAGVNSSPEDVSKGKNLHLRCYSIEQSKTRAAAGAKATDAVVAEMSRNAFFTNADEDVYQRLLRTAGGLGAAASAMGKESQLAVFDAQSPTPQLRGLIELPRDAEELDVVQLEHRKAETEAIKKYKTRNFSDTDEDEYLVVFCYKYELWMVKVGKTKKSDPELIFTMPDDHGVRPAFRSVRFLTPGFLVTVSNLPGRTGALIQGFRLPTPAHDKARIAASVRISGNVSATSLTVANVHPAVPAGDTQFLIAMATTDCSIHIYSVDHVDLPAIELLSKLYPLCTLKNVHKGDSISGVAFSTFIPPTNTSTSKAQEASSTTAHTHYIKLASITLQKNVAVHSIPLRRQIDTRSISSSSSSSSSSSKDGPKKIRYITAMRARAPSNRTLIVVLSIIVLIMAIVGQSVLELYGWSEPVVHIHKFLPGTYGSLRDPAHPPAYFFSQDHFISKLAGAEAGAEASGPGLDMGSGAALLEGETLVLWEAQHPATADDGSDVGRKGIKLDVHSEEVHGPAKPWEDLSERQKKAWREKLHDAGVWTQNMGESVFKGILFSEIAGAVGRAVAG